MAAVLVLLPLQQQGVSGLRPARGRLGDGPAAPGLGRPADLDGLRSAHSRAALPLGAGRAPRGASRGLRGARLAGLVRVCGPPRRAGGTRSRRRQGPRGQPAHPRARSGPRGRAGSPGPGAGARARRAARSNRTARAGRLIRTSGPSRRASTRNATSSIPTSWLPSCCRRRRPPRPSAPAGPAIGR